MAQIFLALDDISWFVVLALPIGFCLMMGSLLVGSTYAVTYEGTTTEQIDTEVNQTIPYEDVSYPERYAIEQSREQNSDYEISELETLPEGTVYIQKDNTYQIVHIEGGLDMPILAILGCFLAMVAFGKVIWKHLHNIYTAIVHGM
jgi:hypothetical protein